MGVCTGCARTISGRHDEPSTLRNYDSPPLSGSRNENQLCRWIVGETTGVVAPRLLMSCANEHEPITDKTPRLASPIPLTPVIRKLGRKNAVAAGSKADRDKSFTMAPAADTHLVTVF
jgi:hypothetical protein